MSDTPLLNTVCEINFCYTDKCKIIHIGHSNCHADSGNKLETVDEEKDLGVIVSKDLNWGKHAV